MQKPIVKLLPSSPTEDQLVNITWVAARGCYSDKSAWDLYQEALILTLDKKLELFRKLCKERHRTTLTHAMFNFSFDKIPIKIATQLTRQGVGTNYDQRSTRYLQKWTKGKRAYDYGVQPIRLREGAEYNFDGNLANHILEDCYSKCAEGYEKLREIGVPAEDASYVLNTGAYTGLTASFNIVSFRHWINTRLLHSTGAAQGEHEELSRIALDEFKLHYPSVAAILFEGL